MATSNRELWVSFIAVIAISLIYLFVVVTFNEIPGASDLFGHSIGILGFILMLMTETLYTWRKRSRSARWGRMASWLQFHIFTGLVGPFMVLLHSSWKFNGLAGLVMLLTVVIVISGFMGRYIYTAVPRSADGIELESGMLEEQARAADSELQGWLAGHPESLRTLARLQTAASPGGVSAGMIFGRAFEEWSARQQWRSIKARLDAATRPQAEQLEKLLKQKRVLHRQLASLAMTRRLLGLWHAVHIPVGMALFTAAFIHIIAAVYYATLLH